MIDSSTLIGKFVPLFRGATFIAIVIAVEKVFGWADAGMSQEGRARLTQWIKSVPGTDQIDAWASVFPNLVDKVFGSRAFSFKFFLRSCIASIAAVAISGALEIAVLGKGALTTGQNWAGYETLTYYLWLTIPINCVPDYFSLLFSRFIVRRMARYPTPLRIAFLLILDGAVSVAIPIAAIGTIAPYLRVFGLLGAVDVYAEGFPEQVYLFLKVLGTWTRALLEPGGWGPFLRLYLFASLFTSVWVWLYVIASVVIRILHRARSLWIKILPFLSIEDRPMQAIGRVAGLIVGFLYLALAGGFWLMQRT